MFLSITLRARHNRTSDTQGAEFKVSAWWSSCLVWDDMEWNSDLCSVVSTESSWDYTTCRYFNGRPFIEFFNSFLIHQCKNVCIILSPALEVSTTYQFLFHCGRLPMWTTYILAPCLALHSWKGS